MPFLGFGRRASRDVQEPVVPANWNYPRASAGDTGTKQMAQPKGLSAPIPMRMPDALVDQRLSERISAFSGRLPLQWFLREQKVVQVVPQMAPTHHLYAPQGPTESAGAYVNGMYRRDYSLQTQMGLVHAGKLAAPPRYQNVPGYADIGATIAINGQYASINGNIADLYTNLRAPGPFEGMVQCQ